LFIATVNLPAQENIPHPDTLKSDSIKLPDNVKLKATPFYVNQIDDTEIKTISPTKALFKSMFIPGWGQVSNKKYFKAGIIVALETTLIYHIVKYSDKTSKAEDIYKSAPDSTKAVLFNKYSDYKDMRNLNSWFLGTLVFLSMFDAFVDAHLSDFPKKNNRLSLELFPPEKKNIAVRLSYNF